MRYYTIEVLNLDGTEFARYTSFVNGATDGGALQVEFDITAVPLATPAGASSIKIWGVSLQTISQASDFNGKLIKVYGGMQRGLPLANPAQAGLLVQGSINQAFGNWVETNQWVEFIVVVDGTTLEQKANITQNWLKGTPLSDAIKQTLAVAAPAFKTDINISAGLVLPQDEPGFFGSLVQFAQYIKQVSAPILGGSYAGVDILITEDTFRVYDGTTATAPTALAFQDLVGQPTWIDPATIQVTAVMRADVGVGQYVTLPPAQATTTAASLSQFRDRSVFQGTFQVDLVRHVGNFRQPDAAAWITVMNMHPQGQA